MTAPATLAHPTRAQYARELDALCRTQLLGAATAATQKSITTSSAPLATQESEIIARIAKPFETRLLAIAAPAGNATATDLRANVRRDVALDSEAVKEFQAHDASRVASLEKAQSAAEDKVDADADRLGASSCESY